MIYFFGFLLLFILLIALPASVSAAIALFFVVSGLLVQIVASCLCRTKIPFSKSLKAVAYVSIFSSIAFVFTIQILNTFSAPYLFILLPIFVFSAQALGYTMALEIPFFGGTILSICLIFAAWLISLVFNFSFTTTLRLLS